MSRASHGSEFGVVILRWYLSAAVVLVSGKYIEYLEFSEAVIHAKAFSREGIDLSPS